MELFTIIIPIYNVEKYLEECINSVINQTYKNLDIILVNDGSQDKSLEICKQYKKSDTRINLISKTNGGLSSARNVGLENARGKYVMFLDSDDYLYNEEVVEKFINIFRTTNCDLIYGSYTGFLDESQDNIGMYIKDKRLNITNSDVVNMDNQGVLLQLYKSKSYASSAATKVYKKEVIDTNGLEFKMGIYHEDEEWTPKVIANTQKVYVFNEKFYMRRYRPESIMTTQDESKLVKRINDLLSIANWMIKYTDQNFDNIELKNTMKSYFGSFIIRSLILYKSIATEEYKNKAKQLIFQNLHLFKYMNSAKFRVINILNNLVGIDLTASFLSILLKIKTNKGDKYEG
ncbi:glycosyltransferase family 2 protein [Bacillus solimangrovi]|uniref:Glycosyltransferase 2-like domain-containing protein n=1 Tax=Bacillus solimangrovi TaxID=1305675 RepID=A0A1E5LDJ7_9BACI|nr:glycosyltransferase [Bacillus solimangrovi]OEH92144.1 hypothetical protein BFG57_02405 [Bacillus solimangrovi]